MSPVPWVTTDQEKTVLERCLSECKRRLNYYREEGNELQVAMAQADLDRMLEELGQLYKRIRRRENAT